MARVPEAPPEADEADARAPTQAEQQIEDAKRHKEDGNVHFQAGDPKKALAAYHKVFCYLNGLQVSATATDARPTSVPEDRVEEYKALKLTTKLNMAACYLKTGQLEKCVAACTSALEGGASAKAFFRRGQAHLAFGDLVKAVADLEKARELAPEDAGVVAELRKARRKHSRGDAQECKRYAKMIGADEEPGAGDCKQPGQKDAAGGEPAAEEAKEGGEGEEDGGYKPPPSTPAIDLGSRDEARKLDKLVRPLTYAWEQTDAEVKVYISFDQDEELQGGVSASQVEVEFGEWSALLVINSTVEGRPPFGLRLADFFRRVVPDKCTHAVRGSRVTLRLHKLDPTNWFTMLQNSPMES